jgi:hypothetical protein
LLCGTSAWLLCSSSSAVVVVVVVVVVQVLVVLRSSHRCIYCTKLVYNQIHLHTSFSNGISLYRLSVVVVAVCALLLVADVAMACKHPVVKQL